MAKPLALVLLCLVQAVVVLDATIVAVVLPAIRADLHLSPAGLQWVVTAYALTFGGFLLVAGRAADLLGARGVAAAGGVLPRDTPPRSTAGRWARPQLDLAGAVAATAGLGALVLGLSLAERARDI